MTLVPTRTPLPLTVQIQTNSGWQPYFHTDEMEEALALLEKVVSVHRSASRVIENENGNIVQEKFPYFPDAHVAEFDWRKDGF